MKILLIQPPVIDFYRTSIRTQPIGLAYLAASLKRHGHEVEILDCQTEEKRAIPLPPELSYLKEFYPFNDRSPFKLYTGFYHFGMGWEEIKKEIEGSEADIFGISSSFTTYHGEALQVAKLIKEWNSKKVVVMGGSHVSCDPRGVLKSPFVDYVILGEGEFRFPALIEQIQRGKGKEPSDLDGVGYQTDGEIRIHPLQRFIEDLNSLPFPERRLLDLDRYRIGRKRSTMMITSRGCPHGCAYCSAHLVMGSSFRVRRPKNILQEMIECRQQYGIEVFDIEDDNFSFDLKRAKKLMALILKAFGERGIELSAMNGISFASLDGELLSMMKRAGFRTLNLSFVSNERLTQERLGRPHPLIGFEDLLREAEKVGLNVIAYAILGIPGQTIGEMLDTLIDLMGKRVLIGPSIYYPTPGTPLFQKCSKGEILPPHSIQWRSSALPVETETFDRLDMVTLLRLVRVINFVKGKMDVGELEEGVTLKECYQILKSKTKHHPYGWPNLLLRIFEELTFVSLRKYPEGEWLIQNEPTSRKVLDGFFKRAWERPILASRTD